MKRRLLLIAAVVLLVPATAEATLTARQFSLVRGDSAFTSGGDTACTVVRPQSSLGFLCKVGGDYRARYGVIINSQRVSVIEYHGFNSYRVVTTRRQSPLP